MSPSRKKTELGYPSDDDVMSFAIGDVTRSDLRTIKTM